MSKRTTSLPESEARFVNMSKAVDSCCDTSSGLQLVPEMPVIAASVARRSKPKRFPTHISVKHCSEQLSGE